MVSAECRNGPFDTSRHHGQPPLLIAAMMALSVLVTATHAGAQTATPPEGSAISFALTAADGSAVTERTYRGKWLSFFRLHYVRSIVRRH